MKTGDRVRYSDSYLARKQFYFPEHRFRVGVVSHVVQNFVFVVWDGFTNYRPYLLEDIALLENPAGDPLSEDDTDIIRDRLNKLM